MMKHSKQREAIREALQARGDHPTADTMYQEMREVFPHISLGTVYRNLSLLCELGEAQKVTTGDGRERFDCRVEPHDHFRCRLCGKVMDMPEMDGDPACCYPAFEGRIESRSTVYTGVCADCVSTV